MLGVQGSYHRLHGGPNYHPSTDDQDEPLLKSVQAALMRLHEQLGHCSFAQLKQMAEQGLNLRKLGKIPPPKCPSCLYGKAHQKPWRTYKIDPKIQPSTIPGAVVSIDQFESPVPGSVSIAEEQPTIQKYHRALVFVDHASDFTYVHMNYHLTMDETLNAKYVFKCLAAQHGYESFTTIVIMEGSQTRLLWTTSGCHT